MQKFLATIEVTINTIETVSDNDVLMDLQDVLDKDYDYGTAEVKCCDEIP